MSGHKSRNNIPRRPARPAADHRLDQFAAAVAEARANNPGATALAALEDEFIDAAMDIGAHLDRATVGAAWLILGQLMGTRLQATPPEQQSQMLGGLFQVARLAGQRLYTGDRLPVTIACPYTYLSGDPCKKSVTGPSLERADTLMGAHVWQQHPGEAWPPQEGCTPGPDEIVVAGDGLAELVDEEGEAFCACGDPAVMLKSVTNRPDGKPGTLQALCRDCAADGEAQA